MTDAPLPPELSGLSEKTASTLRRYARAALIGPEELADRVLQAHFRALEAEAVRVPDLPKENAPSWGRFTQADGPLIETFLIPRLQGASEYARISGYFRSTALVPIRGQLAQIPKIRLLCNAELDQRDIDTAQMAGSFGDGPLPQGERFRTLHTLLRSGQLEVRVLQDRSEPFLHGKAGLIRYPDGRACGFVGSVNDTLRSWTGNYEILWEDATTAAADWVEAELSRIWELSVPLAEATTLLPTAPDILPDWYENLNGTLLGGFDGERAPAPAETPEPEEPDQVSNGQGDEIPNVVGDGPPPPDTVPQAPKRVWYPERKAPVYGFRNVPSLARAEVLETSWPDRAYSRPEFEAIIDAALYRLCRKMSANPKQDLAVVREHVGLTVKKRQEPGYQHSPTTGLYYPRQSVEQALRISDRVARVIDLEFRARVSDEATGETFTLTSAPEEVPQTTPAPAATVRPGSCVEYETADPVTGKPKRMKVFIMRSPDDVIGEDGVQSIGNATPVAKALLEAEMGEKVFLEGDGPKARPLRIVKIW